MFKLPNKIILRPLGLFHQPVKLIIGRSK